VLVITIVLVAAIVFMVRFFVACCAATRERSISVGVIRNLPALNTPVPPVRFSPAPAGQYAGRPFELSNISNLDAVATRVDAPAGEAASEARWRYAAKRTSAAASQRSKKT
jgi:hypothetical protein